jgi:hypothetical protein
MSMLLVFVVAICFAASLLPFLFPGSLISALGVVLNAWLGELLAGGLGLEPGALLTTLPSEAGRVALTLEGVLVVYAPVLLVLVFLARAR